MSKRDSNTPPIALAVQTAARQVAVFENNPELLKADAEARRLGQRVQSLKSEIEVKRHKIDALDSKEADARQMLADHEAWQEGRVEAEARALLDGITVPHDDAEAERQEVARRAALRDLGVVEAGRGIVGAEIAAMQPPLEEAMKEYGAAVQAAMRLRIEVHVSIFKTIGDLLTHPLADALAAHSVNTQVNRGRGRLERLDNLGEDLWRSLRGNGLRFIRDRNARHPEWLQSDYASKHPGTADRTSEILADLSGGV